MSVVFGGAARPPVDPDAPTARRWLLDELSKPSYQAAKPNWFDLASQAVENWFGSLFNVSGHGLEGVLAVIVVLIVVALIVAAFLLFGVPRLNRSSSHVESILDGSDARDAAEMRRSATRAAERGDWGLAVEELFRALATSLSERTIVMVSPGTTARELAMRASAVFPTERSRLAEAARTFDSVRYLGRAGTAAEFGMLQALDEALRASRPAAHQALAGAGPER